MLYIEHLSRVVIHPLLWIPVLLYYRCQSRDPRLEIVVYASQCQKILCLPIFLPPALTAVVILGLFFFV